MSDACDEFLRRRGQSVNGFRGMGITGQRTKPKPADERELRKSVESSAREIERRSSGD